MQLRPRLHAGAKHGRGRGIGSGKQISGKAGRGARADSRQARPVHHGQMFARGTVRQDDECLDQRESFLPVLRKHREEFQRVEFPCRGIAGHHQCRPRLHAQLLDRNVVFNVSQFPGNINHIRSAFVKLIAKHFRKFFY